MLQSISSASTWTNFWASCLSGRSEVWCIHFSKDIHKYVSPSLSQTFTSKFAFKGCSSKTSDLDWWPPPPRRQLGGGSWPWGWQRRWRGRVERNGWRRWRVHVQGGQGETTATRSREDCFYMIDSTWFCISPILKPNFHTDLLILFYGINVERRTVYWWYCW